MNLHALNAMHKLASLCSSSRQVSLQEAVYYSLPELWLRKCFARTVFVNTSIPSERIRICKSVEEIEELDQDSADIFKRNMVDRYFDRPNSQYKNGMYGRYGNGVFLKISQNSHENTFARVSFLIKLQACACNFIKKEALAKVFSCEICEILKNTFFYITPLMVASETSDVDFSVDCNDNYLTDKNEEPPFSEKVHELVVRNGSGSWFFGLFFDHTYFYINSWRPDHRYTKFQITWVFLSS